MTERVTAEGTIPDPSFKCTESGGVGWASLRLGEHGVGAFQVRALASV